MIEEFDEALSHYPGLTEWVLKGGYEARYGDTEGEPLYHFYLSAVRFLECDDSYSFKDFCDSWNRLRGES